MPIPINRTLVVGLGKTGRTIAHRLRRRLQEQYSGVPYVAFLTIYPEGEPKGDPLWTEAEELELSAWALNQFIAKNPEIHSRLSRQTLEVLDDPLSSRLGANLAFLRLMREGREGKIAHTLQTTVQRLFGPRERFWQGTSLEFEVTRTQTDQAGREVPVREMTVYIIAALNDPVGSGILLDFVYALQTHRFFVEGTYDCSSVGVLLSLDESPSGLANTYAALKEIDAAMSQGKYQNDLLNLSADYRPFKRACYFVELSNEAGYPEDPELRKASYGEVMVAEWLRWMITHLEVEVEMGNIESRLVRLGFDSTNVDAQKIPAYSSFGFAAGMVPVKELLDYFAYRLGGQFASHQCLLALPPQGAEKTLVETFWKERAQMDARAIADVMTEEEKAQHRKRFEEEPIEDYSRPMEGRTALPIEEQRNDSALFPANNPLPPEPGPSQELEERLRRFPLLGGLALATVRAYEFVTKGATGLYDLRQRIRFQRELQEHSEREHHKRLERKLVEEIVPWGEKVIRNESWQVVSSEPVGGVSLAIAFCQTLNQKLSAARDETEAVYNKLQEWARQGIYKETFPMPFTSFIFLTAFVAFLGLAVTIFLAGMGLVLVGTATSFLEALVLGQDLWGFFSTYGFAGTMLFAILNYLYNVLTNLTRRTPMDRPVLADSYLRNWMLYLALYTTVALLGILSTGRTELSALFDGGVIFVSSGLIALEYLWMHRQYQRSGDRDTYTPSSGKMSLGIALLAIHTVLLSIAAPFLEALIGLSASPLLWRWLLIVGILGAVKYVFDFFFARFRMSRDAIFHYGDMGSTWGTIFFVILAILGWLALVQIPFYSTVTSRFIGVALAGLVIYTLFTFAVYSFRRLQLYEFAFLFPPAPTPACNYWDAERKGDSALKNKPGLWLTLWRIAVMSLLTLVVIFWMERETSSTPLVFLSSLLASEASHASRIALLALLGAAFAFKYLYDLTSRTHRTNLPTTDHLISWLAFVIVITAVVSLSVLTGLGPLGDWVDATHRHRVLIAVLVLGILAILRYVWEYINDLARIWYLVKDWVDWYERMALQRLRIATLSVALQFYDQMQGVINNQVQALEQFRDRLAHLDQQFAEAEDAIRDHILQTEMEYQRYVLDPQRAERIYHDQVLADIGAEARAYFKRQPLLETWRWQSFDMICQDLKIYVNERFDTYWREHGVINFLGDSEHPTFRDLERKIGWLFARACKPYWRYYGATHGEFFAYVGVPARESEELKEAVAGLAGPLIGGPIRELVTGDPYAVTSITFRHGVPLHLLSSMPDYQRAYETQIENNPWLHTRHGWERELPGLFPGDDEAQRWRERRRQGRSVR